MGLLEAELNSSYCGDADCPVVAVPSPTGRSVLSLEDLPIWKDHGLMKVGFFSMEE